MSKQRARMLEDRAAAAHSYFTAFPQRKSGESLVSFEAGFVAAYSLLFDELPEIARERRGAASALADSKSFPREP